jgi:hypothetical protein
LAHTALRKAHTARSRSSKQPAARELDNDPDARSKRTAELAVIDAQDGGDEG